MEADVIMSLWEPGNTGPRIGHGKAKTDCEDVPEQRLWSSQQAGSGRKAKQKGPEGFRIW